MKSKNTMDVPIVLHAFFLFVTIEYEDQPSTVIAAITPNISIQCISIYLSLLLAVTLI
ncbi:hypothetical protein [Salicibibacter halophilus]|uniref:hypothetical protein n=1 Tax=Salicibibacter halophilus TaxID=2502791 RepID=UPI0013596339|nr:hypothetical protein [Salicibibacter halophilus]